MAKKAKKLRKEKRGILFNGMLVRLAAAAVAVGCAALIISTESDCSEKQRELDSIQEKIDAYEADNSELQRILDSDDMSAYMEKVAMEEQGYAYPDERRFYDTSRD